MKNPWLIIIVLVVVVIGGSILLLSNSNDSTADEGVVVTDHVKGNPDSTVVLEEFGDFQCPACAQFYPAVEEILDEYGDQIQFEFRHFPLTQIHPFAMPAAQAAEAAGQQGKFFEFYDALYQNQAEWSGGAAAASSFFAKTAESLDLDMSQFSRQQRSSLLREKIQSDMNDGIARGVNSTPTFFLNGQKVQLSTLGDLKAAVEAALGGGEEAQQQIEVQLEDGSTTTINATPQAPAVQFGF